MLRYLGLALLLVLRTSALNFTVAGGQIFTPGFAVVDAPQPGTPLGGGMLSAAPSLQLPVYPDRVTGSVQAHQLTFLALRRPYRSCSRRLGERQAIIAAVC